MSSCIVICDVFLASGAHSNRWPGTTHRWHQGAFTTAGPRAVDQHARGAHGLCQRQALRAARGRAALQEHAGAGRSGSQLCASSPVVRRAGWRMAQGACERWMGMGLAARRRARLGAVLAGQQQRTARRACRACSRAPAVPRARRSTAASRPAAWSRWRRGSRRTCCARPPRPAAGCSSRASSRTRATPTAAPRSSTSTSPSRVRRSAAAPAPCLPLLCPAAGTLRTPRFWFQSNYPPLALLTHQSSSFSRAACLWTVGALARSARLPTVTCNSRRSRHARLAGPESVRTPSEVYQALTEAGWRVDYLRLPQVARPRPTFA